MNGFYVFVTAMLPMLAGCSAPNARVVTKLNKDAALTGDISMDPLRWKVITSGLNPNDSTMSTLFGNDSAVQYSRTSAERNYPDGSVLSLVTWKQQEDGRWFGARIPAEPNSVEFLTVRVSKDGQPSYSYRDYEGSPLKEITTLESSAKERVAYLLSQRAAVMP
jgi:hypothetical protein